MVADLLPNLVAAIATDVIVILGMFAPTCAMSQTEVDLTDALTQADDVELAELDHLLPPECRAGWST